MYCFSKCCRLCLIKDNTLLNMNWSGSDGIPFLDKLGLIVPSLVANPRDYIPWICEQCRKRLNKAYSFIKHCLKTDVVLDEYCKQLTSADTAQNKCTDLEIYDIHLIENMINESISISVKEECFEDLPAIDNDHYYFGSTITIEKHELSPADFEIKLEPPELKQEADLTVGDASNEQIMVTECNFDPTENVQIDQAAGISGENYISVCVDGLKKRTDDYNTTTLNSLPKHGSIKSRIPLKKRPFQCATCNKTFSRIGNLNVHKKIHTDERPFKCKLCNKKCINSGHLKEYEAVHTGNHPFKCNTCNKPFTKPSTLKIHERIHSGERPFKCNICNKTFVYSSNLKEHKRLHSGERPYNCEICNKTFIHSGNLKEHVRIHSGERTYECEICSNAYAQSSALIRHKKLHNKERPFKCNTCTKAFTFSASLRYHERVHSGERPFECKLCNKTFTRSSSLKRHESVHNNDVS